MPRHLPAINPAPAGLLLALLAFASATGAQSSAGPGTPGTPGVQEKLILDLTNQDRAAESLPPLTWSPTLAAAAAVHANAMAQANNLSHQLPGEPNVATRAAAQGARFQAVAENIAYGPSAPSIEHQWMHSAPHRANILDPRMNSIGIGLVQSNGTLWAVEDFSASEPERKPSEVEKAVAQELTSKGLRISAENSDEQAAARAACPQFEGNAGAAARFVVRWESSDLGTLPQPLADAIASGQYTRAAVGACPAINPRNTDFAAYRVAVLLF